MDEAGSKQEQIHVMAVCEELNLARMNEREKGTLMSIRCTRAVTDGPMRRSKR